MFTTTAAMLIILTAESSTRAGIDIRHLGEVKRVGYLLGRALPTAGIGTGLTKVIIWTTLE